MRDEYEAFTSLNTEILAVGPDNLAAFQRYWANEKIPYIGLPDPAHSVAKMYQQEINVFKFGRMPLVCIVGRNGRLRYIHYGASMSDIPDNQILLQVIDELNKASI
jgi:peroxiredoxin